MVYNTPPRARSLKSKSPPAAAPKAAKADGGGLRFNNGKNQLELIPPEWTWGLGMVLTRGAIKYAVRNWERGMKWSYPVGCALRHILKFTCGERYDAETGCHHLAMAAWNCLALMTYDLRDIGDNDVFNPLTPTSILDKVAVGPGEALRKLMDAPAHPAHFPLRPPLRARYRDGNSHANSPAR